MIEDLDSFEEILCSVENHSLNLSLNRPEKLNSLTKKIINEINAALDAAAKNENIKVILIRGSGNNFSSGMDITQFENLSSMDAFNFHRELNKLALRFRDFPKPIIAILRGYALGGGLELAQSADIRIAAESAILGQPEIDLGINAGIGGNAVLPRLVGRGRALYMIFTGDKISARKAYEFGLVDLIFSDSELDERVRDLVQKISEKQSDALYLAKMVVNYGSEFNVSSALEYEAAAFGLLFSKQETKDNVLKFLGRKKID